MIETLKSIIDSYNSGLLSTPNIQVVEKKLSDETIKFSSELIDDLTFSCSTFKNSHLINMHFVNVNFESSFFEGCIIENCIFENTILRAAEYDNCVFTDCFFINCNLTESDFTETTFKECTLSRGNLGNSLFELCHFVKTIFKELEGGSLGSAVLVDSTFSNSKKSIEFKGNVYFNDILNQINKLYNEARDP